MRKPRNMNDELKQGLELALARCKGAYGLAKATGVSYQAIQKWRRVPAERVHDVEKASGVPRHLLRPDLYPIEREQSVPTATDPDGDRGE
jgi:DNA-binding transcriptional regulator YdaS (Cro superfamily)